MISVAPVSCGECGDVGFDSAGEPCVCGGPLEIERKAKLRRFGWFPMYDLENANWKVCRVLDDEADDRGVTLSDESATFISLEAAVAGLCT